MAGFVKQDWLDLVEMTNEAGFDAIELNLSCPHGMNEKGMGRACGEDPEVLGTITKWVVSASKVPVIVKITPNYGQAEVLAEAALQNGAQAVTLTNTMPGLIDPYPTGEPFLPVGSAKQYSAGGTTGSVLRPFALKKCADVAKFVPDIEIFGSGGIISGDHAMSYLQYGAKALQVCSAVQNLDLATVYYDLKTSLQANLYMVNNPVKVAEGWKGQYPPFNYHKLNNNSTLEDLGIIPPNIPDIIGKKLHHVSFIDKMSKTEYQIPEINDEKCLQCGRCYLACSDSGYQAIKFDGYNTFPIIVEEDCTGCAICHSVCPVENAIHMVPRTLEYKVNRGTEPGPNFPKEHLKTYPPLKF